MVTDPGGGQKVIAAGGGQGPNRSVREKWSRPMQAAGSFYMSMYFLLVDLLTHNLQLLSYYMETVEQGYAWMVLPTGTLACGRWGTSTGSRTWRRRRYPSTLGTYPTTWTRWSRGTPACGMWDTRHDTREFYMSTYFLLVDQLGVS